MSVIQISLVSLNTDIEQMNSPEIKAFIHEHSNLFWYTPEDKKEDISKEFLVETILKYGDLNTTVQLFHLLGIQEVAKCFFDSITLSNHRKGNYHELTILRLYSGIMHSEIYNSEQVELLPSIKSFQRSFTWLEELLLHCT